MYESNIYKVTGKIGQGLSAVASYAVNYFKDNFIGDNPNAPLPQENVWEGEGLATREERIDFHKQFRREKGTIEIIALPLGEEKKTLEELTR